jgi:hypothetical protein
MWLLQRLCALHQPYSVLDSQLEIGALAEEIIGDVAWHSWQSFPLQQDHDIEQSNIELC